jgi:hypothetical protein
MKYIKYKTTNISSSKSLTFAIYHYHIFMTDYIDAININFSSEISTPSMHSILLDPSFGHEAVDLIENICQNLYHTLKEDEMHSSSHVLIVRNYDLDIKAKVTLRYSKIHCKMIILRSHKSPHFVQDQHDSQKYEDIADIADISIIFRRNISSQTRNSILKHLDFGKNILDLVEETHKNKSQDSFDINGKCIQIIQSDISQHALQTEITIKKWARKYVYKIDFIALFPSKTT